MKGFTMIKNFLPSLPERGKIKIGMKGEVRRSRQGNDFQLPQKLDHFRVTTMQRGPDGNFLLDETVHGKYGPEPIDMGVLLLYDEIDLNFQCRYTCYKGRQQWCFGNGENAIRDRVNIPCPCERLEPDYKGQDKCKVNGCLSVIIAGAEVVGGVWKFRTTSYNSVVGILGSLALIKQATAGPLAGIPLTMSLRPKTVVSPADGKVQTIYVVGLDYLGTFEKLQALGYDIALNRQKHQIRMDDVENQARKLIAHTDQDYMDPDTPDEFYPEQAAAAEGVPLAEGRKPAVHEKTDAPPADLYGPTTEKPLGDTNVRKAINAARRGDSHFTNQVCKHEFFKQKSGEWLCRLCGEAGQEDVVAAIEGAQSQTAAEKIEERLNMVEADTETQEDLDQLGKDLSAGIPEPKENPPDQNAPTSGAGHEDWKAIKYMKSRKGNYLEEDPKTGMEFKLGDPRRWTGMAAYLRDHHATWTQASYEQQQNCKYKWGSKTMFGTSMFPIADDGHLITAHEEPKSKPEETINGQTKGNIDPTQGSGSNGQEGGSGSDSREVDKTPGSQLTEHERNDSRERLQILKAIVQNYEKEVIFKAKKNLGLSTGESTWPISTSGCISLREACADIEFTDGF